MKLSAPSDKDIILKPIQPNLGVEAAYRKSLKKLLREMRADVQDLLERHYPKGIAQDSLTDGLQAALSALLRYWLARLDKLAPANRRGICQSKRKPHREGLSDGLTGRLLTINPAQHSIIYPVRHVAGAGVFFSPITGWERSQRMTDKCRLLNRNQLVIKPQPA